MCRFFSTLDELLQCALKAVRRTIRFKTVTFAHFIASFDMPNICNYLMSLSGGSMRYKT